MEPAEILSCQMILALALQQKSSYSCSLPNMKGKAIWHYEWQLNRGNSLKLLR